MCREDGKDALKFYTDPGYFFELWRQDMLKDQERLLHEKGKKVTSILSTVASFEKCVVQSINFIFEIRY
jgi:hypothetical protein